MLIPLARQDTDEGGERDDSFKGVRYAKMYETLLLFKGPKFFSGHRPLDSLGYGPT